MVTPRGELGEDEKSRIEIFQKVAPSVVYIRTKGYQQTFDGSVASKELASGSGFVWDEDGHIITNLHVVKGSFLQRGSQLEVQLSDGRIYDAEFIGAVSKNDIAVLRIQAERSQLVPITIGSSDDLQVGQNVLAIGNPFGFDRTLSTGVIGGLNRSVGSDDGDNILSGLDPNRCGHQSRQLGRSFAGQCRSIDWGELGNRQHQRSVRGAWICSGDQRRA